jgi:hypothetical protein
MFDGSKVDFSSEDRASQSAAIGCLLAAKPNFQELSIRKQKEYFRCDWICMA